MSTSLDGIDLGLPPITPLGVGLGLAVLVGGLLVGQLVRLAVSRTMLWRGRGPSSAAILGRVASWLVGLLAVAAALAITFPSIEPGNLLGGIVILTRDRFRVGDQISVLDHRGTIVQMGLTSTSIRAFDGRLVLVPNATMHSEVVTVRTGFEQVRSSVTVDLADTGDLTYAADVAVQAMRAVPAVLDDPPPEAFLTSVGTKTAQLELRFWSGARQLETKEATHAVIVAVLAAFAAEGVEAGDDVLIVDAGPRLAQVLERPAPDEDAE